MGQNSLDPTAHNLVMGDFNFTVYDNDRYSYKEPIGWKKADKEAPTWHNLFSSTDKLNEIYQPLSTYHHAERMSRIDRIYTSLGHADLLPLTVECKALFTSVASDHRPVSFALQPKRAKRCGVYY